MKKPQFTLSALGVKILGTSGLMIMLLTATANTPAIKANFRVNAASAITPAAVSPANALAAAPGVLDKSLPLTSTLSSVAKILAPVMNHPGVLDQRHRYALGMLETGNQDDEVGGAGEVSRYQIMPAVWQHYSDSEDYNDPQISLAVAQQHWTTLYNAFKEKAHREPTDFDMYVLWNTHFAYYSARNFDPARLGPIVRDRAQRYVNLVEDTKSGT